MRARSPALAGTRYLPHLDGLRTVALAGVMLYHFESPFATGGFVGVDCFLVLSGFLISRNILVHIVDGRFSLRQFYMRRFWRLYPAASAVTAIAVVLAFLSFPEDLALLTARSALSSLFLLSNIYFMQQSNYFDEAATLKPLLHTWSLSLEEQFYLLWPLLMTLLTRDSPSRLSLVTTVAWILIVTSLLSGVFMHSSRPVFVFFMLPCRVYEFGIGALCAIHERRGYAGRNVGFKDSHLGTEILAVIALATICTSFHILPQRSSPLHILPALIATSFIILKPHTLIASTILSNPFMTFLGRLSYSGYLVHWITFVFTRYVCQALHVSMPSQPVLTATTILLAWVLCKAVEAPFRKAGSGGRAMFFTFLVSVFVACVSCLATSGWSFRLNGQSTGVVSGAYLASRMLCRESAELKNMLFHSHGCEVGAINGSRSGTVVMGDSFARHLMPAFDHIGKKRNLTFTFNFMSACPFVSWKGNLVTKRKTEKRCLQFHQRRWAILRGERAGSRGPLAKNSTVLVANLGKFESIDDRRAELVTMENDLDREGYHMALMGEPPGLLMAELWRFACLDLRRTPFGRLLAFLTTRTHTNGCVDKWTRPKYNAKRNAEEYRVALRDSRPHTMFIDVYGHLCAKKEKGVQLCRTLCAKDKVSGEYLELGYTRDASHLTTVGSIYLANFLEAQLQSRLEMVDL